MQSVTRRQFSRRLLHVLMYGGLAHFAIFDFAKGAEKNPESEYNCLGGRAPQDKCEPVSKGRRETDFCPGGGPDEDVCNPSQKFHDACPGEKEPEDECPENGARGSGHFTLDECNSGKQDADICISTLIIKTASDQCQSGNDADDLCEPREPSLRLDVCPSGISPEPDKCENNGTENDGDYCPGGGAAVDNCDDNQSGDECANEGDENNAPDQCKDEGPVTNRDECLLSADVCYEGTDSEYGMGGTDSCLTLQIGPVKGEGSDQCIDGSSAQDRCGVPDYPSEPDVCIVGAKGESGDVCAPPLSPDQCYAEFPNSDECNPSARDPDECPKGMAPADECNRASLDPDECPGGASCADECKTGLSDEDECPGGRDEVDVCLPLVDGTDECGMRDPDECSQADEAGCEDGVFGSDECAAEDIPDRCTAAQPDHAE